MLFVRTEGILNTMIKAPLILAGLIVVAFAMPIQTSFSSTRTLELTMYSDGSTHISTLIEVDSLSPDFEIDLFGPSVDNFVAVGDDGFLLSSEIIESKATIDTLGSSTITVDYDIHDLISKEGRVLTFSFDSPSDYTLLMPSGSIIVGMTSIPNNMEIIEEQTKLDLSVGPTEINYILGLESEAKKYAVLLGYNYQSSEWYKESYRVFNKKYEDPKDKIKKEEGSLIIKKFKGLFE